MGQGSPHLIYLLPAHHQGASLEPAPEVVVAEPYRLAAILVLEELDGRLVALSYTGDLFNNPALASVHLKGPGQLPRRAFFVSHRRTSKQSGLGLPDGPPAPQAEGLGHTSLMLLPALVTVMLSIVRILEAIPALMVVGAEWLLLVERNLYAAANAVAGHAGRRGLGRAPARRR